MNIKFENNIQNITRNINDGTNVMKKMSDQVKDINFSTLNKIKEKNLVEKLRGQISDFSLKFSQSKKKFDEMKKDFEKDNLAEAKKLSDIETNLRSVNKEVNANKERVSSAEQKKRSIGYDLDSALNRRNDAQRKANIARSEYYRAKKEKAKWERDCAISAGFGAAFAWTGIAPAVAAGLCAKYIDTVGDKQAALDKLNSRLSTAQSKVRTAQNYEDQYNTAKSKLSHVKRIQNRLESSKKCVQSSVYVQKTILKELAELLEKIQTCKTQVDMIQARFNTVQGKFKHILTNNYKTDSFSVA